MWREKVIAEARWKKGNQIFDSLVYSALTEHILIHGFHLWRF